MRFLVVTLFIVITFNLGNAQWDFHRNPAGGASSPSFQSLLQNQAGASTAGRFIIKPDRSGSLNFDPAVAGNLQRILDSLRSVYGIQGLSAAVLIPGKGTWLGVSGLSTVSPRDSIKPDMLFSIASNTKGFTSALMLKMVEEGKVSLDDSLGKYLPTYPNIPGSVTIRQLLNMTSGIFDYVNFPSYWDSMSADTKRYWTPEDILHTFIAPPGPPDVPVYSGTNYLLSGMIIQAVAGSSIPDLIHQRLLDSLNLDQTYFPLDDTLISLVAHPWYSGYDISAIYDTALLSAFWCVGNIYSTAENMARWAEAFYGGQVLSPAAQTLLTTTVPGNIMDYATENVTGTGYGLGVMQMNFLDHLLWGHVGGFPGYASQVVYFPMNGTAVAVLSNSTVLPATWFVAPQLLQATLPGPREVVIDKNYARPSGIDTIRLTASVYEPDSILLPVKSFYMAGGVIIDSSLFYDDGLHNDGSAGDGLWGTWWKPPPGEEFYSVNLQTRDHADSSTFTFHSLGYFTTAGPLMLDSVVYVNHDNPSYYSVEVYVINRGQSATIDTAWVSLTSADPWVASIYPAGFMLGNIAPGARSLPHTFVVNYNKSTFPGYMNLKFQFGSQGHNYWDPQNTTITRVSDRTLLPVQYVLEQNYPNPFNPATTIRYQLPKQSHVTLRVFDLVGREVATLVNGVQMPGYKTVVFDGRGLSSGVYIYKIVAGTFTDVKRLMLMK